MEEEVLGGDVRKETARWNGGESSMEQVRMYMYLYICVQMHWKWP